MSSDEQKYRGTPMGASTSGRSVSLRRKKAGKAFRERSGPLPEHIFSSVYLCSRKRQRRRRRAVHFRSERFLWSSYCQTASKAAGRQWNFHTAGPKTLQSDEHHRRHQSRRPRALRRRRRHCLSARAQCFTKESPGPLKPDIGKIGEGVLFCRSRRRDFPGATASPTPAAPARGAAAPRGSGSSAT